MTCGWPPVQARTEEARLTLLGCLGEQLLHLMWPSRCRRGPAHTHVPAVISLPVLAGPCLAIGASLCSKQLHAPAAVEHQERRNLLLRQLPSMQLLHSHLFALLSAMRL